ncbi:hypothetical protein [Geobacter sp. DSM 9736]|uniref:hypothetical protein n=1 Tax=Geobacter sp. DSM 9736 TaxID=1277350 RepID=UPI000B5087BD|nr:hypothetical protein [Geobacter sp. DSM 9736]SNB47393.1 hypothetical protein SAMN06269301_2880 [Geobacter sp. DSM 9736]
MKSVKLNLLFFAITVMLAGCGGGGESGGSGGGPGPATKTVTLTFGITNTAPLNSVPIYGVVETVIIPAGVTVPAEASQLKALDGVQAIYSESDRRLRILAIKVSDEGVGLGDFAQITCTVAAGASLSAGDFVLRYDPPDFTANSIDNGNTVDLTAATKPTLTVTGL